MREGEQMAEGTGKAGRVTPLPSFRVTEGDLAGTVLRLEEDSGTLGRREGNDYVLEDLGVSRVHARITREAGSVVVTDLGSSGGTKLNGEPLDGPGVVQHGDRVTFGSVTVTFEDPSTMVVDEEETVVFEMPDVNTGPDLSPRQLQVVELIAEGLTNREIGERLGVTERTIKAYAGEVYKKLDVSNRAGAVAEAARLGLV